MRIINLLFLILLAESAMAQNITQTYAGQGHTTPSQAPTPSQFYAGFVTNDATNYPASHGSVFGYTNSNNGYGYSYQIFKGHTAPTLKVRFGNFTPGNVWFPWRTLFDSGNDMIYEGTNVESKLSNYTHIYGRASDGILHLHAGNNTGQVFINNAEAGNIILAKGGGNVSIGSSLYPTDMLTLQKAESYANIRLQRTGSNPADFKIWSGYGQLEFRNSTDAIKLVLKDNGNIGIGTIDATDLLTLAHNSSYAGIRLTRTDSHFSDFKIYSGYGQLEFRNSLNATKFVLKDNGNIGIGTTDATHLLTLAEDDNYAGIRLIRTDSHFADFKINSGYGKLEFRNSADETKFVLQDNGYVGIGTESPDTPLAVKGIIHAQEVRVDLTGAVAPPDYVFEPDYDLTSLSEVETYIKENKHLPEVPSAKQMEEEGLNLKEMNLLLLKKLEGVDVVCD
jgi:hypothetical protein